MTNMSGSAFLTEVVELVDYARDMMTNERVDEADLGCALWRLVDAAGMLATAFPDLRRDILPTGRGFWVGAKVRAEPSGPKPSEGRF